MVSGIKWSPSWDCDCLLEVPEEEIKVGLIRTLGYYLTQGRYVDEEMVRFVDRYRHLIDESAILNEGINQRAPGYVFGGKRAKSLPEMEMMLASLLGKDNIKGDE